jgi:tetratricopeptide (TPR) repeat protein
VKDSRLETALEYSALVVELRRLCLEQAKNQPLDPREIERCEFELHDVMILQVEILTKAGRFDEAYALMEESLALKRASRDESGLTWALYKYAQLLADTGRVAEARPIFEEVLQHTEASGDRSVVLGWYRHDAALMALHESDLRRGREMLRASYEVFEQNAVGGGFLLTLYLLVYLHGIEGNWPLVALTLGAGDAARGTPYPDDWQAILEAQERAARAALGNEEFELQYAIGTQLEPQQAIEAALLDNS